MDLIGAHQLTSIWQRTLAPQQDDSAVVPRQRLRSAYEALRRNAADLVAQINKDLPQATLHDIRHLDALWTVADLIAGPEYELTPTEAFVFGCSILLHDAGHALASLKGGLEGLKQTLEWRDAAVASMDSHKISPISKSLILNPPSSLFPDILFATLRSLHGRIAESLADLEIENEKTKERLHILEDNSLRISYGKLIGQLAASHNWDIEELTVRLQSRVGAIADLPGDWTIDPIKIACLLRSADAAQIDQRRAPDFLFALLKFRGLSQDHWLAQNKLAQPLRDRDDPQALLYSSTSSYSEDESDAWWIAFDLVTIINRELYSCNALLRDTGRPEFLANRVRDAESPARLAKHITTHGWTPVQADVKISDASAVAGMLGGKVLYGNSLLVPLRELLQNAGDAIRARRYYEQSKLTFEGKIQVRLREEIVGAEKFLWLDVEDDGVGMSERILTGPLLDFGISLWRHQLVEKEFPGLRGSEFRASGLFGIGFYSVFMIAQQISVASKRFDQGIVRGKTLLFGNGLTGRPLLIDRLPDSFPTNAQTVVSLRIKPEIVGKFLNVDFEEKTSLRPEFHTTVSTFAHVVAELCPTLDCDVFVASDGSAPLKVHDRHWYNEDGEAWLTKLFFPQKALNRKAQIAIKEAAARLTLIYDGGRVVGRAAISLQVREVSFYKILSFGPGKLRDIFVCGHVTYGGFSSESPQWYDGTSAFFGLIDGHPHHASRYSPMYLLLWDLTNIFAYPQQREEWLDSQVRLLKDKQLGDGQRDAYRENFARFGRLLEGYFKFRVVEAHRSYNTLSETEVVSVEDIGANSASIMLLLPIVKMKAESIQALTYFDKKQTSALSHLAEQLGIDRIYLSGIGNEEMELIPRDLSDVATYSGILAALVQSLKGKGFLVSCSTEVLDANFKKDKTINRFVSGILRVTAHKV